MNWKRLLCLIGLHKLEYTGYNSMYTNYKDERFTHTRCACTRDGCHHIKNYVNRVKDR